MEVTVNKRKVTRNIIEEKSGRVMEVETEVTTDDSDEDVLNAGTYVMSTYSNPRNKERGGKVNNPYFFVLNIHMKHEDQYRTSSK